MFQFRRFPSYTYGFSVWYLAVGFPIRKSPDRRIFAPPRSLSQLVTSFFGSWCQGIPLALFIAWPIENNIRCSRLWIMQASQILEIVIVTLHPFGCCSTIINFTLCLSFNKQTSLLPYFTCFHHIVQFSRCMLSSLFWSQIEMLNHLSTSI